LAIASVVVIGAHHAGLLEPCGDDTCFAGRMSSSVSSSAPDADRRPGTALVTGATAGIGRVFAERLAARGHDLVLVARDGARLESVSSELRRSHGVAVEVLAADLVDRSELSVVEARLADRGRPVDLLVNNAGFGLRERFLANDVEQEQALLDVLVTAVLRLSHAALGGMVERGRGGVINVSSVASFLPRGTYGAAKAWVNRFSEWAAHEYRPQGVTVMVLCPGFVKTEFHQRMGVRRGEGFLWLDADFLVDQALADFDAGRVVSVPGAPYKAVVAVARLAPTGLLQRFQSIGRR
jgi:short-subunit dehydrogenase